MNGIKHRVYGQKSGGRGPGEKLDDNDNPNKLSIVTAVSDITGKLNTHFNFKVQL